MLVETTNIKERLCLFTRYPQPGTTKTRLIKVLGETGAAELQRQMTAHILDQVRSLVARRSIHVSICYEGGDAQQMAQWLGSELSYTRQATGDIGRRMAHALRQASVDGFETVVLIGADIPGMTADILNRAFDGLRHNDMMIGPAKDGGYYLIGLQAKSMEKAVPGLFKGVTWSTSTVLSKTLELADTLGLRYSLLDELGDVDLPADISRWETVAVDSARY